MPGSPALMQCPKGQTCEWRRVCQGAIPHVCGPACQPHHNDCLACQPVPRNSVEHNGPASIIQAIDAARQFGKTVNLDFIRAQAEAVIEYHKRRDNGENPAWHDVKPQGIPQFL